jgi:hypothetical protein
MTAVLRLAVALGLGALGVLSPSGPALAARFTGDLDAVEAEVAARDGALTGVLTREEKKRKAAFGKALAALAGDTTTLVEELKLAGKVAKVLAKALPGDGAMDGLLEEAVDALEEKTGLALEDLALDVDDEPDTAAKVRADKALLQAYAYLEGSPLEETFVLRLTLLQKAHQKTRPVVKYLDAPPPGGGGGGGACFPGTRNLAAGEFLTATYAPTTFQAGSVATQYQTSPSLQGRATFHRCTASTHEQFQVYFFFTPAVDTAYPFSGGSALGVSYGSGDVEGLTQVFTGDGSITFSEVNVATGTYAGTFTFSSVAAGVTVTEASFKVTGLK